MKKRVVLFFLLSVLFCSAGLPAAAADTAHEGHRTVLRELVTESHAPTPFCGQYYCEDCAEEFFAPVSHEDVGMPLVNIVGSLYGISKENRVTVQLEYSAEGLSFCSHATLKVQGNWSVRYPKKNLSVKFCNEDGSGKKLTLSDSWGRQSRYCLKANWIDYSQARNIVSARIFSQIIHSRNSKDRLGGLRRGGQVDGYPVLVYLNGDYYGLYTMNIPKEPWLFSMKGPGKQALLVGRNWSDSIGLFSEIRDVTAPEKDGWELEYCSTGDDPDIGTAWVGESMNALIRFLQSSSAESFREEIERYTDVDRAIDVFLYTAFLDGLDNRAKNIIWASYDGVKWIPCMYDMDSCWGLNFDGSFTLPKENLEDYAGTLLFIRLATEYPDTIRTRYWELRETYLNTEYIMEQFSAFDAAIPSLVRRADRRAWPAIPGGERDYLQDIRDFCEVRGSYMDAWFREETPQK